MRDDERGVRVRKANVPPGTLVDCIGHDDGVNASMSCPVQAQFCDVVEMVTATVTPMICS